MEKKPHTTINMLGDFTSTCNTHGVCGEYICYKCHLDIVNKLKEELEKAKKDLWGISYQNATYCE